MNRPVTQNEVLLKLILDSVHCGIIIIDPETHKILETNQAADKMIGLPAEEIAGKECHRFVCQAEKGACPITDLGQLVDHKERILVNNEGESIPVIKTVVPLVIQGKSYLIESLTNISKQKRAEDELKYHTLYDNLTGVYNRTYFEEEMNRQDKRKGEPVGILICDVDGLKNFNDTMGNKAGDFLLKAIADLFRKVLPQDCIVARTGGDEFCVLINQCTPESLPQYVCDIVVELEEYNKNNSITASVSLGYQFGIISAQEKMKHILKKAEDNMKKEKLLHRQSSCNALVSTLMHTLGERDFITGGHAKRMENIVVILARSVGIAQNIPALQLFSQFHDIGKIGIPDHILNKPAALDKQEKEIMQRHSEIGYRIAQSAPVLHEVGDWILKHHEWWNGQGYPLGLKQEEIPIECRILAIADAYDAMTSDRPYRKALTDEVAIRELMEGAGSQFDPQLVKLFIKLKKSGII